VGAVRPAYATDARHAPDAHVLDTDNAPVTMTDPTNAHGA
jgi:hypothetical protein